VALFVVQLFLHFHLLQGGKGKQVHGDVWVPESEGKNPANAVQHLTKGIDKSPDKQGGKDVVKNFVFHVLKILNAYVSAVNNDGSGFPMGVPSYIKGKSVTEKFPIFFGKHQPPFGVMDCSLDLFFAVHHHTGNFPNNFWFKCISICGQQVVYEIFLPVQFIQYGKRTDATKFFAPEITIPNGDADEFLFIEKAVHHNLI